MAYQLYITRGTHFANNAERRIGVREWITVIEGLADLRREVGEQKGEGRGEKGEGETVDLLTAFWRAGADAGGLEAAFVYRDGNVVCRNPDEAAVGKLVELAAALGAGVQGEDGEWYVGGDCLPELRGGGLFEKPSARLRVRFPRANGEAGESLLTQKHNGHEIRNGTGPDEREPGVADTLPEPGNASSIAAPDASLDPSAKRKWKMNVGFPGSTAGPSAKMQALCQPLRPVDTEADGERP